MAYSHEYYLKNKEKYLAASKKYLAKQRAEKGEEWLEKQNNYMKNYYAKNPDKRKAKMSMIRITIKLIKEYFKAKAQEYKERKNDNK